MLLLLMHPVYICVKINFFAFRLRGLETEQLRMLVTIILIVGPILLLINVVVLILIVVPKLVSPIAGCRC